MCFDRAKTQKVTDDIQMVKYEADTNEGGINAFLKTIVFRQGIDENYLSAALQINLMDLEKHADFAEHEMITISNILKFSFYPSELRKSVIIYDANIKKLECENGFSINELFGKYLDKGYTIFIPFIQKMEKLLQFVVAKFAKERDVYISSRKTEDADFVSYAIAPISIL